MEDGEISMDIPWIAVQKQRKEKQPKVKDSMAVDMEGGKGPTRVNASSGNGGSRFFSLRKENDDNSLGTKIIYLI